MGKLITLCMGPWVVAKLIASNWAWMKELATNVD
jgi:hypothetical protein